MKIAVMGASGRMGRVLIRAVCEIKGAVLSGGTEQPGSPAVGADLGTLAGLEPLGVAVSSDASAVIAGADAILDFTAPAATVEFARTAAEQGVAHIIGTTGCSSEDEAAIAEAATRTAIVKAGNMSLGVNLLTALTAKVAAALDVDFDIEILEMHHRHKVDAPSGTALMLAEAAAKGRGVALGEKAVRVRDGHTGPRRAGDIGMQSLRGGSIVGDHSVIFAGNGERITLSHHAEDRSIFARGAVKAALWARDKEPGLYSMIDVLGL
ncbi:MAG: 4-hydroxy-tetrahydrodipicolinate reductase [Alphaproteobacteria bacterium BRH_c36]|nr:MAG: 4-hydroxy-tetrahydrodipicolinate reductase [Alphaproteobacteria bacterium BRH_c36]